MIETIIIIYISGAAATYVHIVKEYFNEQDRKDILAHGLTAIAAILFPIFWMLYWIHKSETKG